MNVMGPATWLTEPGLMVGGKIGRQGLGRRVTGMCKEQPSYEMSP